MGRFDLVFLELKHREISRREFLGMLGFGLLALIGIAPLLQMADKRNRQLGDAGAFGSSDFGGESAARAVKQATAHRTGGP